MARNTLGGFIAILRKANGLTQRELAEKLNVSDKSVSRWERDETAPDLSLLPIIADLFGVSCDELLRGERISDEKRSFEDSKPQPRATETVNRLLKRSQNRAQSMLLLSITSAFTGLIIAMAVNFGFHRAGLAFFGGLLLLMAGGLLALLSAMSALNNNPEDPLFPEIGTFRRQIFHKTYQALSILLMALFFLLPLVVLAPPSHTGLTASSWFSLGILCAAIAFAISYLLYGFVMKHAQSRNLIPAKPEKSLIPLKTKRIFALTAVTVLLGTFGFQGRIEAGDYLENKGVSFFDAESFKAYMEAVPDLPEDEAYSMSPEDEGFTWTEQYYDKDGNLVQFGFGIRNPDVNSYTIHPNAIKENKPLAVVYSWEDMQAQWQDRQASTYRFQATLAMEIILAVAVWHLLKKKRPSLLKSK